MPLVAPTLIANTLQAKVRRSKADRQLQRKAELSPLTLYCAYHSHAPTQPHRTLRATGALRLSRCGTSPTRRTVSRVHRCTSTFSRCPARALFALPFPSRGRRVGAVIARCRRTTLRPLSAVVSQRIDRLGAAYGALAESGRPRDRVAPLRSRGATRHPTPLDR